MFQANKWNWKRVAAKLLLVPVLTGGSVAFVHAQLGVTGAGTGTVMPTSQQAAQAPKRTTPALGDPKQLLKDGRKALAEGRFADAQDLAQAAESSNPGGKWGLFDDTPTALRKDIQTAKAKSDKAKSEQLVKQAKALAAKPAANDGERAYNLDTALQMARTAEKLHGGPYTLWEMNDRADKLVHELQDARAKLKVAATAPPAATGPRTPTTPATTQTAAQPAASADAKRQAALKLMSEGRQFADQGNFVAARTKYAEADKLGATFVAGETTPSFALQDLSARGAAAMDKLVRDSQTFTAQRDYARADAALKNAAQIAATLNLFPRTVVEAQAALYVASGGKAGVPSPSGIAPTGGRETLVRADAPGATAPGVPAGTQTVYNTRSATPDAQAGGTVTGRQLLEQAKLSLASGDFESAERIARQAFNAGMQQDAGLLLNTIDAERMARKKRDAATTVEQARLAYQQKNFLIAYQSLAMIDLRLLADDKQAEHKQLLAACKVELDKAGVSTGVVATAGLQPADKTPLPPGDPMAAANPPGTAHIGPDPKDGPAAQADALRSVQVGKLRSEGFKILTDAQATFNRGECDLAMNMLVDYSNKVRTSGLDSSSINRLLRPVDVRLETFRMMKGQTVTMARLTKEKKDAKALVEGRGLVEEERKQEVQRLVHQYHDLVKKGDFTTAEKVALQAKQLDPDDAAVGALLEMAKLQRHVKEAADIKASHEEFFLEGLNDADNMGPLVTSSDPVAIKLAAMRRAHLRGSLDDSYQKSRTPAEFEIQQKLDKPIRVELTQTPLDQAIKNIQELTGVPLWLDTRTLATEGISEVQPISFDVGHAIAARHVLSIVLESAGLSYVIENDVVKVTTTKKAKGRLVTKVFSVADLVTPVPNFALPDYANYEKMLNRNPLNSGNLLIQGLNTGGNATPASVPGGLGGGQSASSSLLPGQLATTPGMQSPSAGGRGGTLQTDNPLNGSAHLAPESASKHEQLIKLITSMVRPYSWDGHGGNGKVEFFDIGSALVVNQTADVISEVQDLLEALRRLQDLAVAVEIRIVSLSEAFYERMGVQFDVNILTNSTKFQPQLTTNSFAPVPFINSIGNVGQTVGLTPAGSFTPDLNVPITNSSFQQAIPPFGGYPNTPGADGGISLGLAFLNEIQVYMFMELAQGDRRINVMQAPKVTLFNGQTATLSVSDQQFFVASVQVISVNGQLVFVPQNTPIPIGVNITVQAVVSADRRFVRLNLPVTLTTNQSTNVPLFPVTTFITPVFEGGSQGQPIPFTQFVQQPTFTTVNVQTTVVCPDGGTVLLGGLKTMSEGRNEFGPPFLSKIPYIDRLFKNVGVGRESTHVMIMVTPRIIINSEEEIFQTEGRQPTGVGGP